MKHRLPVSLFVVLAAVAQAVWANPTPVRAPDLKPQKIEAQAGHVAAELLQRYHYKKVPLDDAMSEKIFDQYLKALDPERVFFIQSDVDQFAGERARLDDAILGEDLTGPYAIYNRYQQRVIERYGYARELLKKGFDFRVDESYQYNREKEPWAKTEAEVRELWRKRVKNDWLRLKLAGNDDRKVAGILERRYENFLKRVGQVRSTDVFQTFMNAYTTTIEPHTNYLSPRAAADFDIAMRLSLVGIGASLSIIDDYTTIRELIPGGPAMQSGQLQVGDRIVGVAQGDSASMVDVMGWRIDETVALIRGAQDTVVVLDVLPAEAGPDAKHKLVRLVRKQINLAEQAAKGKIQTVQDGNTTRKIGVVTLPSFYSDTRARRGNADDFRSAARDTARILADFRKQKVDGVLIDLRNNGGGSLGEAIELTGLFIETGPVVQQRNARGQVLVERDTDAGVSWDGPLAVLINRNSASASEIFAAAIQDYGRGLVFGERSFGKGTVQTLISLDQFRRDQSGDTKYGELKVTTAQFFRINGGTTQLTGVMPDLVFPSANDGEPFGEASYDNPLPATQIRPADFTPVGNLRDLLPMLQPLHESRVKQNRDFQELMEDIVEARLARKKTTVSLNEATRRAERAADEAKLKARIARKDKNDPAVAALEKELNADDGLQADERKLSRLLAAEKARKDARDVLLNEAVRVLADGAAIAATDSRFAINIRPNATQATQVPIFVPN